MWNIWQNKILSTCIVQDYWRKILAEIIHLKESEGWIQDDLLEVGHVWLHINSVKLIEKILFKNIMIFSINMFTKFN